MHFNFLLADQKTRFRYEVAAAGGNYLLFRCVTDVDFTLDTVWFKLICNGHIVSKQAITGHFSANNTSQNGAGMDSDPHLHI